MALFPKEGTLIGISSPNGANADFAVCCGSECIIAWSPKPSAWAPVYSSPIVQTVHGEEPSASR